jgi:hypothetical protein
MGADSRQADTASTILTGLDLFLFDGEINEVRREGLGETMMAMISAAGGDDERSEGLDALDFLLCSSLNPDHGLKRTVRELLEAVAEFIILEEFEFRKIRYSDFARCDARVWVKAKTLRETVEGELALLLIRYARDGNAAMPNDEDCVWTVQQLCIYKVMNSDFLAVD